MVVSDCNAQRVADVNIKRSDAHCASSARVTEPREAVGWPSGLRRQFKALVSSEAWVRIPLQSLFCIWTGRTAGQARIRPCEPSMRSVPYSLVGQDTWFSPMRPGFESRWGNCFLLRVARSIGQHRATLLALSSVPDSLGG